MIALLSYGVVHNAVLFKIVVVVLFKVLIKHVLGVCRVCGGASDAMPLPPPAQAQAAVCEKPRGIGVVEKAAPREHYRIGYIKP